jgi:hypothetical protein
MLTDDIFNSIPSAAECEACRHFCTDPADGGTWCEWLAKKVNPHGWCGDFEQQMKFDIKCGKPIENS